MVRILRCFDLLEAHTIVARLREEGIAAQVFDADFVRQNWFEMLAYGGFRIVVASESAVAARQVLQDYKNGALALQGEDCRLLCPNCQAAAAGEDLQPRRNAFLAMILLPIIESLAFLRWRPGHMDLLLIFAAQIALYLSVPWLVMHYFKWRMRCSACGHRWRAPPQHRYADLALIVEAAERKAT